MHVCVRTNNQTNSCECIHTVHYMTRAHTQSHKGVRRVFVAQSMHFAVSQELEASKATKPRSLLQLGQKIARASVATRGTAIQLVVQAIHCKSCLPRPSSSVELPHVSTISADCAKVSKFSFFWRVNFECFIYRSSNSLATHRSR